LSRGKIVIAGKGNTLLRSAIAAVAAGAAVVAGAGAGGIGLASAAEPVAKVAPAKAPPPLLDFISLTPWYWSAALGVGLPGHVAFSAVQTSGPPSLNGTLTGRARFNAGPTGSLAIGKYFTTNLRAELRGGFSYNTARSFSGAFATGGPFEAAMTGSVTTYTLIGYGFYEMTGLGKFVPFFGGGVGLADVVAHQLHVDTTGGFTNGSSVVPVIAASLGFGWRMSQSTEVTLAYNAMVGGDAKFSHADSSTGETRAVTSDVRGQSLTAGVKVKF
jgi:hypothetical protein